MNNQRDANSVSVSFAYGDRAIFSELMLSFPENGVVELRGDNGSGKTTLLKVLGRILENKSKSHLSKNFIPLYLEPAMFNPPYLTGRDVLSFAFGLSEPTCDVRLNNASEIFPSHLWGSSLSDLSLGQRTRLMWAYAVSDKQATVILLDEPFNGLDLEGKSKAENLLKALSRRRLVVVALHDEMRIGQYLLNLNDNVPRVVPLGG